MNKYPSNEHSAIRDHGGEPFIFHIECAAQMNQNFRTTVWTGQDMQLTLMSIPVRGNIGAEMHPNVDQFIRITSGRAKVLMGKDRNSMQEEALVDGNCAILIPSGTWHNIVNIANRPLKLYSLYAPPQHVFGTIHPTKEDAEREEH